MNDASVLLVHSVRERLSNLSRNLVAGAVFLIPPVLGAFDSGRGSLPGVVPAFWLSLVFGAGLIGPDASSGVLELMLTRPIVRSRYILTRWAAAAALAGGAAICQTALVAGINVAYGHAPGWEPTVLAMASQLTVAVGLPAILVGFSSMAAAFGDLRLWVLCWLLGQILEVAGSMKHIGWLRRTGAEIGQTVLPVIPPDAIKDVFFAPWAPAIGWLSSVTLGLAVAIAVLNRRELSRGGA